MMFDADAMKNVGKSTALPTLETLDLKGLLRLRAQIDDLLPPRRIDQMNLEEEAVLQFHLAKRLANDTYSSDSPANQKAQTMNTLTAILNQLAEAQTALFNAERIKVMESALERAFQGVALPIKQAFYDRYKAGVEQMIAQKNNRNG